jgi:hypothetical protein
MIWRILIGSLLFVSAASHAAALTFGSRTEFTHPGTLHDVQVSGAAVAVDRDGDVLIAWVRKDGHTDNLYLARPGREKNQAKRINPQELPVDSLHQSPGLAIGPQSEVYISWSSAKPKPEGVIFASDVRLSRSLDGGESFDSHLRINEDRPISHSFEEIGVTNDGTVLLSWIDSREGWEKAGTYVARIGQRGTQIESVEKLDGDTCVCCRVHLTTGSQGKVAVLWRKVFPDNIRDMVLGLSHDSGQSFSSPVLVHADRWQLNACPHRGGTVGIGDKGQIYAAWYTEGAEGRPAILFATSSDGSQFTPPQRVDVSSGSIPDHVHLVVNTTGQAIIVWEDATAVHRRVLLRYTTDGGRTLSPIHSLSQALKAYAPGVALSPSGEFVTVWHEEQFPLIKTIIQPVRLDASA